MTIPVDTAGPVPAVCLFCHPDDEFGIFAEIEAMVAEGARVICVYLTDGAYGGQSAARREAESQAVLRRLGVRPDDVHFLGSECGIGDGRLHQRIADALEATRWLLASLAPAAHRPAPTLNLNPKLNSKA